MKTFVLGILLGMVVNAQALMNVQQVDKNHFSGLWYEIARTYNDYEKTCVAATVEYVLEEDGYRVFNRCFDSVIGGELIEYEGTVEAIEGSSMHAMEMTYFWIFSQDYNVIYLNDDYSTAIVSDKGFEQLWIMHRRPEMPQAELGMLLDSLEQYIDLNRLIFTPQDPQGRYQ